MRKCSTAWLCVAITPLLAARAQQAASSAPAATSQPATTQPTETRPADLTTQPGRPTTQPASAAEAATGAGAGPEPADAAALIARSPETMSVTELIEGAREAFDAKNLLIAKNYIQEVMARDERNIDVLLLDAEIALAEHEVERAKLRYTTVIRIQPNDFTANLELGRMYARKNIFRQANWYLTTAHSVAPEDELSELLVLLSTARRGMGKSAEAQALLEQAARLDPENVEALEMLVTLHLQAANFDEALRIGLVLVNKARNASLADPGDRDALKRLHDAYGVRVLALRSFHRSNHEATPEGGFSDRLVPGKEKIAAETLREIVDILTRQVELSVRLSHFDMLELAEKAVEYDDTNHDVLMQYGMLLMSTAQYDKARGILERALELDPDNADAQQHLDALPALFDSQ